jgi:kinesin family protein C1
MESALLAQRDELVTLRAELNRRQTDMERTTTEKAEQDRNKSSLSEELITVRSMLREAEGDNKRGETEIARLTSELQDMKSQVNMKEADQRSTLNSLNDVQRQASEDKASLRSEISALQTRAQFLEDERLSTTSQLAAKKEECNALARDVAQKEAALTVLEAKFAERDRDATLNADAAGKVDSMKELLQKAEYRENCATTERIAADSALRAIQSEHNAHKREIEERFNATIDQLRGEIAVVNAQRAEAAEELRRMGDTIVSLENQIREQHKALENTAHNPQAVAELGVLTGELANAKKHLEELQKATSAILEKEQETIHKLESDLRAAEVARRKLHNQVQELRGNIRVFARVRPFLPNDGHNMDALPPSAVHCSPELNSLAIVDKGTTNNFNFDRVFGQSVSQEALFAEVSEFVQSALDGYNVCLFSYGQTGSGKVNKVFIFSSWH